MGCRRTICRGSGSVESQNCQAYEIVGLSKKICFSSCAEPGFPLNIAAQQASGLLHALLGRFLPRLGPRFTVRPLFLPAGCLACRPGPYRCGACYNLPTKNNRVLNATAGPAVPGIPVVPRPLEETARRAKDRPPSNAQQGLQNGRAHV